MFYFLSAFHSLHVPLANLQWRPKVYKSVSLELWTVNLDISLQLFCGLNIIWVLKLENIIWIPNLVFFPLLSFILHFSLTSVITDFEVLSFDKDIKM